MPPRRKAKKSKKPVSRRMVTKAQINKKLREIDEKREEADDVRAGGFDLESTPRGWYNLDKITDANDPNELEEAMNDLDSLQTAIHDDIAALKDVVDKLGEAEKLIQQLTLKIDARIQRLGCKP